MRHSLLLIISLCSYFLVHSQIPAGYYNSAIGLKNDSLKTALNDIIDGHIEFPYTSSSMDTWDVLKLADRDPTNSINVIGIYSNFSMNGPLEYNSAQGWSREHVWAKSRGDFDTSPGIGTDLHNLRAEDVSTNTARNNRNFDYATVRYIDGSGNYFGSTDSYTSSTDWIWEPRDEVKGDIARTIFYMDVRYEGENGELDLELTDSILPQSSKLPLHGNALTLYQWHLADTVSIEERMRNDTIFKYQQNRNPFVDHPEFVEFIYKSIYGTVTALPNLNKVQKKNDLSVYPNPSVGRFTISLKESTIDHITIIDLHGRIISNLKVEGLKTHSPAQIFKSGIYIVKVADSDGNLLFDRLIVQ